MQGQAVTQVAHDVITICPETDDKGDSTEAERPDGNWRLGRELAGGPDEVDGGEGTDGAVTN